MSTLFKKRKLVLKNMVDSGVLLRLPFKNELILPNCCECHRKGKTLMSKGGSEPLACLLDRRLRELTQRVNNAPVA